MNVTILYDDKVAAVAAANVDGEQLWLSPRDMRAATGWKLETEGLCKGDVCVRVDPAWRDGDGNIDVTAFAHYLGQPLVHDAGEAAWAFGESVTSVHDALFSLQAPDFSLPDLAGKQHALSDYRGKKVFLYSWGSY